MTRPQLLQGKAAADYVGVKPSWFRTLCRLRGLTPAKAGPNNGKLYKKSDLDRLRRENRHPGRPKTRKAKPQKSGV